MNIRSFERESQMSLASHPDFQVIGATADDKTALSLLSLKPDLLVLDLDAQAFRRRTS
mgnify:CR=1 FL=1